MQLTDPAFPYIKADKTNISQTLRKNGFVPPTEQKTAEEFEAAVKRPVPSSKPKPSTASEYRLRNIEQLLDMLRAY